MRNILVIVGLGLLLMVGVKRMTRQNIPVKFNNNPTVIGSKDDRNPFGVMFANAKYVSIAKDLGVKYYRPLSLSSSNWDGTCVECEAATNNGLGLILTVRNSDSSGLVANPPTDL